MVINSILLPLLLYPVLLWATFSAITFVKGQEDRFVSRVALVGFEAAHDELREKLGGIDKVELVEAPSEGAEAGLRQGRVDAVLEIQPASGAGVALAENYRLLLRFDGSKDRSEKARERVSGRVGSFRAAWLRQQGLDLGLSEADWRLYRQERVDRASEEEIGAFVLGLIVPLLVIIMVAVGCFYPAVDATAGERERSTWETLMTVSASRSSIVVAKYLYVATMGSVAGVLNLFAMAFSMRAILAPLLAGDEGEINFALPWGALPLVALAVILLALFLAAGMMIFAAFARSFKEGQSMVSPFYMLAILPPLLVQSPDLVLTPRLALIPIANVSLLFRDALSGRYHWPAIGLTLLVELVCVVLALLLASRLLRFEEVILGAREGGLLGFLRRRFRRGGNEQLGEANGRGEQT